MHTFLINTSGKELRLEHGFLDIARETRQLLFLNCPLSSWMDDSAGYRSCAYRIGERIDSYEEVGHGFNLILYTDLFAVKGLYEKLHQDHNLIIQDMWVVYALITHYYYSTLLKQLRDVGLEPREAVVLFSAGTDPLANAPDRNAWSMEKKWETLRGLLHWPEDERLENTAREYLKQRDETGPMDPVPFQTRLLPPEEEELFPGLNRTLSDSIRMFLLSFKENNSLKPARDYLLEKIFDQYERERDDMPSVSFVNDPRWNIREASRKRLLLTVYIMKCIQSESLYLPIDHEAGEVEAEPLQVPDSVSREVLQALFDKKQSFQKKLTELKRMKDPYYALHLAPYVRTFSHELFGLNEYGEKAGELDKQLPADVVVPIDDTPCLLSSEGYPVFDAKCDAADVRLFQKNVNPAEYIREADRVRRHHLNYWYAIQSHITNILSRYMSKSVDNCPPMIEKRKVSITDDECDEDAVKDYRYSRTKGRDDRTGEQLQQLAENSYRTVQMEFVRFFAARPMVLTDPEEQCEWLKNRISQISDTLRKLRRIAGGMAIALPILYLPYVLIQWSAITAGLTPLLVFALSTAVPAVLLYGIFGFVSAAQKRKYRLAWKDFRDRSNEILAENIKSSDMQNQLFGMLIPTAKWVYEYKLDVEFYIECCKTAQAKLNHHQEKMQERIKELDTLLDNLEAAGLREGAGSADDDIEIDYNVAFCQGRENREFYTVLFPELLDQFNYR